jgi:multicomponent Na+:H+ antiporter subunit D
LCWSWFDPPPDKWPAERDFGRKETAWALLLPPLFTGIAALLFGLLASMPWTPLDWVQLIAARKYLP